MSVETEIEIRQARPDEADAIADLIAKLSIFFLADSQQQMPPWLSHSISAEAIAANLANPQFDTLVACSGNTLAGVIAMRDIYHVHHLFVAEPFQGQGMARKLWLAASSRAIAKNGKQTFTVRSSAYAVPAYQRLGFSKTGSTLQKDGVEFVPMICGEQNALD